MAAATPDARPEKLEGDAVMRLPQIPYAVRRTQRETIPSRGIDWSDRADDGSLYDAENMSHRRYPVLSTRQKQVQVKRTGDNGPTNATALLMRDNKPVTVETTGENTADLLYDGSVIAHLTAGEKQMAVVNTKLVVWPDRICYDFANERLTGTVLDGRSLTMMGKKISSGKYELLQLFGYLENEKLTLESATVTVSGNVIYVTDTNLTNYFSAGDVLTAIRSGDADHWNDSATYTLRGKLRVTAVTEDTLTLDSNVGTDGILGSGRHVFFTAGFLQGSELAFDDVLYIGDVLTMTVSGADYQFRVKAISYDAQLQSKKAELEQITEAMFNLPDGGTNNIYTKFFDTITVTRDVPDLDYIFEHDNRLFGCSNATGTIYVSALGEPMNFSTMEGLSTDAYAVAVGSDGPFTGACRYGSAALFFKANKLHKLLGSYPAEYYLYSYDVDGVQAGSAKSAVVMGEVLYYLGGHGVYAYTGGTPTLISAAFGERRFADGAGGTDGRRYYLSCRDLAATNVWRTLVYDTASGLWMAENKVKETDFCRVGQRTYYLTGGCMYYDGGEDDEDVVWMAQYTPFYETVSGKKRHSKIVLRAVCPRGAYALIKVRYDGGTWQEVGRIVGRGEGVQTVQLPMTRCDKFEMRLSGKGPFDLLSMLRIFAVGSDV